jgi:hypothetical protein
MANWIKLPTKPGAAEVHIDWEKVSSVVTHGGHSTIHMDNGEKHMVELSSEKVMQLAARRR